MSAEVFNFLEALLWFVAGTACLVCAMVQLSGPGRRLLAAAGAVLLVFSFTDLCESRTGAWWDPAWLLALKALCVAALAFIYYLYRRLPPR